MPLKVAFELSDADLEFFRGAMRAVKTRARSLEERTIVAGAARLARQTKSRPLPEFVATRLTQLEMLVEMLSDAEWRLEGHHRERVLGALAYFCEPADLIPDQIPGFGFLDDAVMVELVVQELKPELDAYAEFCRYRAEQERQAELDPEQRRKRLDGRRRAMFRRIDSRRERRDRRGGSLFAF